jgi:hypothetical protein
MPTQVRIYTINRGMLDKWVEFFNGNIVPNSAKYGIKVLGAWVNRPQNEFVWVRTYESDEQLDVYTRSPERMAVIGEAGSYIAKIEVRDVEEALTPRQG